MVVSVSKRLAILVTAACALILGPFSYSAQADFQTVTMNVCGGRSNCDPWTYGKTQQMSNAVYNRSGDFVPLQEICNGQIGDLQNDLYYRLGRYFYSYRAVTVPGVSNANCAYGTGGSAGDYGLGVLIPRQAAYVSIHTLPNSASNEKRVMLCAETTAESRGIEVCSTHLSNKNETDATYWRGEQVKRVTDLAKQYGAVRGILIGGDFNATPFASEMSPIYAALDEADDTYRYDSSGGPLNQENDSSFPNKHYCCVVEQKLDYVFYGAYRIAPDTGNVQPVSWDTLSDSFDHKFFPVLHLSMKAL